MELACTEISDVVSVVSIAAETGRSVKLVKKYLKRRGVKTTEFQPFGVCAHYPSVLVREAFATVNDTRKKEATCQ